MMGKRKTTGTLFDVGNVFDVALDPEGFYAQLAAAAPHLFADDQFKRLYNERRGRYSVPPSLLALLLLLQAHDDCSDAETLARTAYDLRWCVVLGKPAGEPLCAKSTLQEFRAKVVLEGPECLLKASLEEAKRQDLLGSAALRLFIDTKPVLGWGAVKDTYNLLGDGIAQLVRALARAAGQELPEWVGQHGLGRYFGDRTSSLKGGADLDWTQVAVRQEFLREIVTDALRVSQLAVAWLAATAAEDMTPPTPRRAVQAALTLLEQLLGQDIKVDTTPAGDLTAELREGTAPDRICSSTDPDQRHGHKSKSKRFNGHKVRIGIVRTWKLKLVVAVDVLAGNAGDAEALLDHVKQAEANTGCAVGESVGDCAFGGGSTRQEFVDAGRVLYAKSPQPRGSEERFPKSAFQIEVAAGTVTCPAGQVCSTFREDQNGTRYFQFGAVCVSCPLREHCTNAKGGRTIQVHPQETLLQAARAFQATPEGKELLRERAAVEHGLAHMAHLGAGQARYRGREKTRFQMIVLAAVVNLRQIWNWQATQGGNTSPDGPPPVPKTASCAPCGALPRWRWQNFNFLPPLWYTQWAGGSYPSV